MDLLMIQCLQKDISIDTSILPYFNFQDIYNLHQLNRSFRTYIEEYYSRQNAHQKREKKHNLAIELEIRYRKNTKVACMRLSSITRGKLCFRPNLGSTITMNDINSSSLSICIRNSFPSIFLSSMELSYDVLIKPIWAFPCRDNDMEYENSHERETYYFRTIAEDQYINQGDSNYLHYASYPGRRIELYRVDLNIRDLNEYLHSV